MDYAVTTDLARFDFDAIERMLRTSYWAAERPRVEIEGSFRSAGVIPFAAIDAAGQTVGVARVLTDRVTFGWVCDVIVSADHQGKGIGKLLMSAIVSNPELNKPGVRMMLRTKDAHGLYEQFGFERKEMMWREALV